MRVLSRTMIAVLAALLLDVDPVRGGNLRCVGDCDDDDMVSVDELITMVNIALGVRDLLDCKIGDGNDNGSIEVDDLVRAIDNALNGCRDNNVFRTHIDHPFEPFLAFPATIGAPSWVKFTIRVSEPGVVYFQN